jgi:NAD(P)-dependent dehydrogenase (short-subunit alcohol dehydrogenase family)
MTPSRVVLVTGASTGIGEAIVRRLDARGYRILAGIRRPADGDRLRAAGSDRIHPIRLDVTDQGDIKALRATLDALPGAAGLAGLVNNAGIGVGGPIEFIPVDQVRRQFEVNVFGLLAVTQAALPALRAARGRIINIGSIAGITTSPLAGPYCMSKHAVEALTDSLRLELADSGIEVSVIEPGAVKTPIWEKGIAQVAEAANALPPIALDRYGRALRFFEKLLHANNARAIPPDLVVDAVIHALEATPPRTRYLIGIDARVRAFVARVLPDRVGDGLLKAVLARMERRLG